MTNPDAQTPCLGISVIGIGSAFGDDQVGWQVITHLTTHALAPLVRLDYCQAPAKDLFHLMAGVHKVILIDAVFTGAPLGTIQRWQGENVSQICSTWSSHGLDLATLLALGKLLPEWPAEVVVYGVEIDTTTLQGDQMSAAVTAAIPQLIEQLYQECKALL